MNKSNFWGLVVSGAIIAAALIYTKDGGESPNRRFNLVGLGGETYRIDQLSGDVWKLDVVDRFFPVRIVPTPIN